MCQLHLRGLWDAYKTSRSFRGHVLTRRSSQTHILSQITSRMYRGSFCADLRQPNQQSPLPRQIQRRINELLTLSPSTKERYWAITSFHNLYLCLCYNMHRRAGYLIEVLEKILGLLRRILTGLFAVVTSTACRER